MIARRIRNLREEHKLTQSDLAEKLSVTRSSVNAWEMGISAPSTQFIVELAKTFSVSTDFLLGMESSSTLSTDGLSDDDIQIVHMLVEHLKKKNAVRNSFL